MTYCYLKVTCASDSNQELTTAHDTSVFIVLLYCIVLLLKIAVDGGAKPIASAAAIPILYFCPIFPICPIFQATLESDKKVIKEAF